MCDIVHLLSLNVNLATNIHAKALMLHFITPFRDFTYTTNRNSWMKEPFLQGLQTSPLSNEEDMCVHVGE